MKGKIKYALRDADLLSRPAVQEATSASAYIQELRASIPKCHSRDNCKLTVSLRIFERWMEQNGIAGAQVDEKTIENFRTDIVNSKLRATSGRKYGSMSRQAPCCVVALHNAAAIGSQMIRRVLIDARVFPRIKAFRLLTSTTQAALGWFEISGLRAKRKGNASRRLMTEATRQKAIYAAMQFLRKVNKNGLEQVTPEDINRITPVADPDDVEYRRVSRMLHDVFALYRSCFEHGDLPSNPLTGLVDHNTFNAHAVREFIPPSDVDKLRDISTLDRNNIQLVIDRLIVLVLIDTALRRNELASINLSQVRKDTDGGYEIILESQNQKMRDKPGIMIPILYPETNKLLGIYLEQIRPRYGGNAFIIDTKGMSASGQAIAHAVNREAERLDLRCYYSKKRPSPHDLRRTFATINSSPLGMGIEANDLAARMRDGMEIVYRHYVQNNPLITGMKAEKYRQRAAGIVTADKPISEQNNFIARVKKDVMLTEQASATESSDNTTREWIPEVDALKLLQAKWHGLPTIRRLREYLRVQGALQRGGLKGKVLYDAGTIRQLCDEYVAVNDLFGAEYTRNRPLRELVIQHTHSCPDFGAFRIVKKIDAMEIMKTAMGSRGTNRSDAKSSKTETSNRAKQKTKISKTGIKTFIAEERIIA